MILELKSWFFLFFIQMVWKYLTSCVSILAWNPKYIFFNSILFYFWFYLGLRRNLPRASPSTVAIRMRLTDQWSDSRRSPLRSLLPFLQYMGIHMSPNAKWALTDSLQKQSWEFAATRESLSEQDMLCTPWLTINICFVFPDANTRHTLPADAWIPGPVATSCLLAIICF